MLLDAGANVNHQNKEGSTPLHFAKTEEQIKLLLESGANINMKNKSGYTPLHYSYKNTLKTLLESGADPYIKNNDNLTVKEYYYKWGYFENTYILDKFEYDKFNSAINDYKDEKCSKLKKLIKSGANIENQDQYGRTPLFNVLSTNQARVLLEAGANVNHQDKEGDTPLHSVSEAFEHTKILFDFGANIHIQNKNGDTPLHQANYENLKLYLERNPDFTIINKKGLTPKDIYKSWDLDNRLIKLIEEYESKQIYINYYKLKQLLNSKSIKEDLIKLIKEEEQKFLIKKILNKKF